MRPNKHLTLDRTPPPPTEVENLWSEDSWPLGLLCGSAWVPFLLWGEDHTQMSVHRNPKVWTWHPSCGRFRCLQETKPSVL